MFHNRQLIQIPSAFVSNLRFEGARVAIGDDVWLRSPEANLKLGGVLEVRTIPARLGGRSQLALNDSLIVERGTYILNLGIARPIFEVERGTIRFYDDPDLNPTINISALYTVRRPSQTANRPDVRVRVTIGGTLNQPTLALSSPDDAQLSASQTDLLSYLVTGEPAYAILAAPGAEQGATLALRLASSYLSSRFSGGPFDIVQVQTSSLGLNPGETLNSKTGRDLLASTRIGLGGQLGQRTFYNLTTGFCPFGSAGQSENGAISDIAKGIGLRIEHRLDGSLTVAASYEPGTTSLTCGRGSSRLLSQTPPQIGFDLSRRWQF
jgi:translocation and assembly module TamB